MDNEQNTQFTSTHLLVFLHKWHRLYLGIIILSVLLSSIFSAPYFIPPQYKSVVVMFPTASNSISKALLNTRSNVEKDILEFGEDEQIEQMLQILNSNTIRDSIIQLFDLSHHYRIKDKDPYHNTKLFKEYESNVRFRKTENSAVKIVVYDEDAQVAADMANTIADLYDVVKNNMKRQRALQGFTIVEKEYLKLKSEIAAKEDSLGVLRRLGVHDYESQSEMINRQLAMEIAKNKNSVAVKSLEAKLELLAQYGGAYVSLRDALLHDKKHLSELKLKYEEAKVDAEQNLPQKFVVSKAYKAEKKSYPIRWLIVVMTTLGAVFLITLILLLMEQLKKLPIKKKSNIIKDATNTLVSEKITDVHVINEKKLPNNTKQQSQNSHAKSEVNTKQIKINHFIMENNFNNLNVINTILRWRIPLIIISIIAIVAGVFISSPIVITPKFKSWAVIYPSNISPYSEESETEQMYQLLQASYIRNKLIKQFDLGKHYKIDKKDPHYKSLLLYEYNDHISISKTTGEAIRIEVLDKDPQLAKDMVDAILVAYNERVKQLHKSKFKEVLELWTRAKARKLAIIDSLQKQLDNLAIEDGLANYRILSQELIKGTLGTVEGGSTGINRAQVYKLKQALQNKGGLLFSTLESLENELSLFKGVCDEYDKALLAYDREFTYTNIVEEPFVSDKKAYPVRWVVVALSLIGTLFFSLLIIGIIENLRIRKVKAKA